MDVNIDLATSLAITTLVVLIVLVARLSARPAVGPSRWLIGRS
jgi:hypothetical protein